MAERDTGNPAGLSYADAGVDIDAGNALVKRIGPLAKATTRAGVAGGLGGFGALFDLKAAGYTDPILISSTDGVGTKVKIAIDQNRHNTIGIDLVAMCVNDIVVQGAEPLFFLDYFACGRLDTGIAEQVIGGVAKGCRMAGCALIGGETAEMPGLYGDGDYDLAGFTVGAVERGGLIDGRSVTEGDAILGLASNGVHANGFSLVRKIVARAGLSLEHPAPFDPSQSLGGALLTPTRIYVQSCLSAVRAGRIKALAHITGGGLTENLPRVLPDQLAAEIDATHIVRPPVFGWLQDTGHVADAEMWRTFNNGIGMAAVVAADCADAVADTLRAAGETVIPIGRIVRRDDRSDPACRIHGTPA